MTQISSGGVSPKKGEQVNTSADQTPISDGDTYELTLTEGY